MSEPPSPFQSQATAAAFRASAAQRASYLGPATTRMFELAHITSGMRVLDVGAGTGEQTLLVAKRLGGDGGVLGVDNSEPMLAAARETAALAGLPNVEFAVMDARSLDLESNSFDAVVSRNALQFIPDLLIAVAEIRRVMRPGTRFAVIVWSAPERHLWHSVPLSIVRKRFGLPQPDPLLPGVNALGAPGALEDALCHGGLHDVVVEAVAANRTATSAAELTQQFRGANPALIALIGKLPEEEQELAWQAVEDGLRQFEGPDGCVVPGEALVGVGVK